ncbi:serine hydroxymethyltransferase [Candidatus Micrarchaeota archaeon]|nr:serine hydroxymethyltransferase [Candidatus Micrarchaeota archaeon]
MSKSLSEVDREVYGYIQNEIGRQRDTLGLIASENYTSKAVMEAVGSPLTNKYSEGYPGKRYYAGNEYIDKIEMLAIERAKKLFGTVHANVQCHAGAIANFSVLFSLMEFGEKFMGLELSQGGHLTHGSPVNFSGKLYKPVAYAVDKETEMLDYDEVKKRALEEKPKVIIAGYTAYPRQINFKSFREIADECGAYLLADISHFAGLVAGGALPPVSPYADVITTTTHKTLRGPRGAMALACRDEELGKKVDKAVFPGTQGGPLDHVIAGKAVAFHEALQPEFKEYAEQIIKNAKALADELMALGFRLVSGGTDTHLILINLTDKGITGKEAQIVCEEAGIILNRNTIPYDTKSPFITSGIRIGTPCLTTRGMKESEMKEVAGFIKRVIDNPQDAEVKKKVREEIKELCSNFPVY